MQLKNDRRIKISVGQNRFASKWPTQTLTWSDFIEKISKPIRTEEKFEQFLSLAKSKQDELKDVGRICGWNAKR